MNQSTIKGSYKYICSRKWCGYERETLLDYKDYSTFCSECGGLYNVIPYAGFESQQKASEK